MLIVTDAIHPALRTSFGLPGCVLYTVFAGIKEAWRNDLVYRLWLKNNSL
ncbi:MAG: hypothetical protein V5804_16085 [Mucilaginibacter sp.]